MLLIRGVLAAAVVLSSSAQAATVIVGGGATMVQSPSGEERKLNSLRADCASYNRTNVGFLCGFDDGDKTVLQFEERDNLPVRLFDGDGKEIVGVRRVNSYIVLPKLYQTVFVRVGNKEAVLTRAPEDGKTVAVAKANPAAAASAAIPRPGPSSGPVSASGAGAAPAVAARVSGAPAAPEKQSWDVRLEDRTIYATLTRWASQAKPKRQIVWELPKEFEVAASDSNNPFIGTFEQAVDRVLDSFENSDYPPKGCFHTNGVLRVVRRTGDGFECKR